MRGWKRVIWSGTALGSAIALGAATLGATPAMAATDGWEISGPASSSGGKLTITGGGTVTAQRVGDSSCGIEVNTKSPVTLKLQDTTCATPLSLGAGANVTLELAGSNTFTSDNGSPVSVPKGATLTISGSGSLKAQHLQATEVSGLINQLKLASGIGSSATKPSGKIIITSGTVEAIGSYGGAGIGDGPAGSGGDGIEITGGTVKATSPYGGAGIGSGGNTLGGSSAPSIMISGGTVEAQGGYGGTGIGSGGSTKGSGTADKGITISGGTVRAIGGDGGAGIGAGPGSGSGSANSALKGVTIGKGATVYAKGGVGGGAGIGSSVAVASSGAEGIVIEDGATVVAIGGDANEKNSAGDGIGAGDGATRIGQAATVKGGSVKAMGGKASGSNKAGAEFSIAPVNGEGQAVYPYHVENVSGDSITVDGKAVSRAGLIDGDSTFYAYLTGQDHTVNETQVVWKAEENTFEGQAAATTGDASAGSVSTEVEVSFEQKVSQLMDEWTPILAGAGLVYVVVSWLFKILGIIR